MPKAFEDCVAGGGKVWTVKKSGGRYQHICRDSKGIHKGEIKTKKK